MTLYKTKKNSETCEKLKQKDSWIFKYFSKANKVEGSFLKIKKLFSLSPQCNGCNNVFE